MKAFVFPGQGAQFPGMGKDLYESNAEAKALFDKANDILGFDITKIMFEGTADELKQTKVTQPAVFLHSVIAAVCMGDKFQPDMVGGHSLGEFSALVAAGVLSFDDGLRLVSARAQAMQKACEAQPSTMAAVLALPDETVEKVCQEVTAEVGTVVAANYNCPGQLVISGTVEAVNEACTRLKAAGAKRALPLPVGGAFHSPLMQFAQAGLAEAIAKTKFNDVEKPVIANVIAEPVTKGSEIADRLVRQLVSPVRWNDCMNKAISLGVTQGVEVGSGKVLMGLMRKISRDVKVTPVETIEAFAALKG